MSKDFSVIGHALAAPARSAILNLLMDGSSRPASELAAAAQVSPPTVSEHLAVLCDAGLVTVTSHGRQRFYRIADPAVAAALEQLGHLCPAAPVVSYRQSRQAKDLARARLCYDHLAGRLGVALTEAMCSNGWLRVEGTLDVTVTGRRQLEALGIDVFGSTTSRRPLCRECPDWTERRPHLAGRLGAALASHAIDTSWVKRVPQGRGLIITGAGIVAFETHWGVLEHTLDASVR